MIVVVLLWCRQVLVVGIVVGWLGFGHVVGDALFYFRHGVRNVPVFIAMDKKTATNVFGNGVSNKGHVLGRNGGRYWGCCCVVVGRDVIFMVVVVDACGG